VPTIIRATILLFIVLIGSAIAFTGGTGGMSRALEAGSTGSAHHVSILAGGPGSGLPPTGGSGWNPTGDGFTWG
jgi:hypothetical protein